MFTKSYELRYSDYRDFDTAKLSFVLDAIQDVAIHHSDSLGLGVNTLRELGVAWFVHGISIFLEDLPTTKEPIELSTGIKNLKGTTSDRCTYVSQGGKDIAKCIASWFLFDTKKGRITRITSEISDKSPIDEFDDSFPVFSKPELFPDAPCVQEILVSSRDIDTNKHLNNVKGAELLINALPFDFVPKNIKILYKKSAYADERLKVCCMETEKGYYVHLEDENSDICVAGTFEG